MTHAKMILLGAILCVAPCFSRPIFAQVPLYDSATAETVRETRFPSLSSPSAPATAQIGASVPTKYVLARQGALWVGVLRDRGDAIAVEMENGGSTVISKLDVAFIGDSRDEVFEFKRAQTSLTDVDEILKLADWANRRGLAVRGVEFLESVEIPGASVAERRAVERKIAELRESERIRAEIAQKNEERKRAEAVLAANQSDVGPIAQVAGAQDPELERWAKEIPYATLERFGRKMQPVLQKRCGAADCHGGGNPDAENYVVLEKPRQTVGGATRIALLQNLRETFDFVDFDNPDASPILRHPPVTNYAGERVYPFGEDRNSAKDYQTLVDWVGALKKDGKMARYVHVQSRARERSSAGARAREFQVAAVNPAAADGSRFADVDAFNAAARAANVVDLVATPQAEPQEGEFAALFDTTAPRDVVADSAAPARPAETAPKTAAARAPKFRDEYDPAIFNARSQTDDSARRY